uniref:Uncharacterized protein n=1 Tax=Hyaloperonospora arabidopsidis (strain Emoy2) TaxID=559515 RepID=M4C2Z5_HYAAE
MRDCRTQMVTNMANVIELYIWSGADPLSPATPLIIQSISVRLRRSRHGKVNDRRRPRAPRHYFGIRIHQITGPCHRSIGGSYQDWRRPPRRALPLRWSSPTSPRGALPSLLHRAVMHWERLKNRLELGLDQMVFDLRYPRS